MDALCFYKEILLPYPRDRAFKALALDSHNLMPMLLPHMIKSMGYITGDGGVGSIKQTIFTEASGLAGGGPQLHRIDECDPENFVHKQTLIKGGLLFDKMHSVVYEVNFEPIGHDKCVCKVATEYHPKEGIVLKEDDINIGKHATTAFYQAIMAYLVANPDAYA